MKILYAILNMSLFALIQILSWENKDIQFGINVCLFGISSYMIYFYYEKSKKQNHERL